MKQPSPVNNTNERFRTEVSKNVSNLKEDDTNFPILWKIVYVLGGDYLLKKSKAEQT